MAVLTDRGALALANSTRARDRGKIKPGSQRAQSASPEDPPLAIEPQLYPRTYRLAGSARRLSWLGGILLLVIPIYVVAAGGSAPFGLTPGAAFALGGFLIALAGGLGIYLIVGVFRTGVVLSADSIAVTGTLTGTRSLRRSDILGMRSIKTGIRDAKPILELVPRFASMQSLRIDGAIDTDDAFLAWMSGLTDLDAADAQASREAIIADPVLGTTREARLDALQSVRNWVMVGAFVAGIATMVLLFLPTPLWLAAALPMALPWLGILIVNRWDGLFRLHDDKNDARVNLSLIMLLPGAMLWWLSVGSVHLMDWRAALVPAALVSVVLVATAVRVEKKPRATAANVALLFVLSLMYGYGAIAVCDRVFDGAAPQVFRPQARNAHASSGGRSTTYYVDLAPWGPRTEWEIVIVTRTVYDAAARGAPICVKLHPGALGMPWYRVEPCE